MASAVFVDAAYIKSILPQPWAWLYDYLPWMHGLEIGNVGSFCTADPPTWTLPTAAEFLAFVTGGALNATQTVSQFIEDVSKAYLWYSLCECTSGPMPAPLTPSSPPSGLPAINPPGVVSLPNSSPCLTIVGTYSNLGGGHYTFRNSVIFGLYNVTSFQVTSRMGIATGSGGSIQWDVFQNDAGQAHIGSAIVYSLGPGTYEFKHPPQLIRPGTRFIQVDGTWLGPGGQFAGTTVECWCDNAVPGVPSSPCCPPDPALVGLMHQVADLVTLIQRQAAPFAYVSGATHTGLSGHGSFSVGQLIGCAVEVTTLPSSYGSSDGTPVERYDLGFVTFGSLDGYEVSRRIDRTSVMHVPPLAGLYTTIGYTLSPGVVATITEIVREP